jgi:plasmid stabilization system protein ParE
MASHKIEFHEEAAAELEAAFEWYFVRSELTARRFAAEVNRALDLIATAPDRWPVGLASTRKYPLRLAIEKSERKLGPPDNDLFG